MGMTPHALTREQVEYVCQHAVIDGHYSTRVSAAYTIKEHDAAQRETMEQQAGEIERLKGELGLKEEWAHLHADDVLRLKHQLADLTRERDSIGSGLEEANLCIRQLEQQVARLRECLVMAKCPTCDGSGWYHDTDSLTGDHAQAQCRWCVEQRALRETGA